MTRMPVLFVGHGSPMNAIERNRFSNAWRALATTLPTPRAIVAVSAHWETQGSFVTAGGDPATIHDFGNFPRALHEYSYPAPGDAALSAEVAHLSGATPSKEWGLDHGTWSVLAHLYPQAQIPVVQLSVDMTAQDHAAIGATLLPLRDDGVLIMASGNIVHNLRAFMMAAKDSPPDPRAVRFDERTRDALVGHDVAALRLGRDEDVRFSVPTPEHYVPLLYMVGAAGPDARVSFPVEGFDGTAISMRSVLFS